MSLVVRPVFIAGHIAYYQLNIDYITEKFCENKEKPQLQCNGKCHLAKELSVVSSNTTSEDANKTKIVSAYKSFTPLFNQNIVSNFDVKQEVIDLQTEVSKFYNNCYQFSIEYRLLKPPIV